MLYYEQASAHFLQASAQALQTLAHKAHNSFEYCESLAHNLAHNAQISAQSRHNAAHSLRPSLIQLVKHVSQVTTQAKQASIQFCLFIFLNFICERIFTS